MDKPVFLRRWLVLAIGAVLLLTIGVLVSTGISSVVSNAVSPPLASANGDDDRIVSMETVRSDDDPFAGHEEHQLSVLLLDTSGKVFTGTLSYTSTKPLEVVVLFPYNPPGSPSKSHGELDTVNIDGQLYSFTVISSGKKVTSATMPFSGAGLALHTSNGKPFEASASISADIEVQTVTE